MSIFDTKQKSKKQLKSTVENTITGITDFMKLCKFGTLDNVKIKLNDDNLNDVDSNGQTPLIYAILGKNIEVIKFIIELDIVNLNHVDKSCNDIIFYINKLIESTSKYHFLLNILYENKRYLIDDQKDLMVEVSLKRKIKPPFYQSDLPYELKRIIFEDNIELFIYRIIEITDDGFLLACQSNSIKIIEYCIENCFGINFISHERVTPLTFLLYYGNNQMAEELIDMYPNKKILNCKDINGKFPLYYSDEPNTNIVDKLLYVEESSDSWMGNFRIFTDDDFEVVDYLSSNESGSYGSAIHVIDKVSGKNMVVKKYEDSEKIHETTAVEYMLINFINSIDPSITANLYGIYVKDGNIHLVQEYLTYTLENIIKVTSELPLEDIRDKFKQIFRSLLVNINLLHSVGVLHNDIKGNNIMIDENGRLKLIDFGLSQYIGLGPFSENIQNSVMTNFISSPECKNQDGLYDRSIHSLKTYTLDIFSVGVTMLNWILKGSNNYFVCKDNKIYMGDQDKNDICEVDETKINEFDPYLTDLFKKMIHYNPNDRLFAKECLQHEYFTTIQYDRNIDTTSFTQVKNGYSKIERELIYMEEIHNSSKDLKLVEVKDKINFLYLTEQMLFILFGWLIDISNQYKVPFDILINIFPKILNAPIDIKRSKIQGYSAIYFMLTEFQTKFYAENINDFVYLCANAYSRDELINFSKEISIEENFPKFTPVTTHITYLVVKLQMAMISKTDIEYIEKTIKRGILKWAIFNREKQITIWELILCIYFTMEGYDHVIERVNFENENFKIENDELCNRVKSIISKTSPHINEDLIKI